DIHFGVSATSRSGVKPGDTLTYRFDLTNVGDLPFQNIAIDDERLRGAVMCPQSTLAPGESMAVTVTTGSQKATMRPLKSATEPPPRVRRQSWPSPPDRPRRPTALKTPHLPWR